MSTSTHLLTIWQRKTNNAAAAGGVDLESNRAHIVKKSANPAAVTVDDRGRKSKGYSQSRKTLLLNEIDGRGVCAHAAKEPA